MNPPELPFHLSSGVLLEDRDLLLRWGVAPDPQCPTEQLTLRNAVILGGMAADVVVRAKDPLRVARIYPALMAGAKDESEQFDRTLQDLTSRLGRPSRRGKSESGLAEGLFYPRASWTFGPVSVALAIIENNSAAYIPCFQMTVRSKSKS